MRFTFERKRGKTKFWFLQVVGWKCGSVTDRTNVRAPGGSQKFTCESMRMSWRAFRLSSPFLLLLLLFNSLPAGILKTANFNSRCRILIVQANNNSTKGCNLISEHDLSRLELVTQISLAGQWNDTLRTQPKQSHRLDTDVYVKTLGIDNYVDFIPLDWRVFFSFLWISQGPFNRCIIKEKRRIISDESMNSLTDKVTLYWRRKTRSHAESRRMRVEQGESLETNW